MRSKKVLVNIGVCVCIGIILVAVYASNIVAAKPYNTEVSQHALLDKYFSSIDTLSHKNLEAVMPGDVVLVLATVKKFSKLPEKISLLLLNKEESVLLETPFIPYTEKQAFSLLPIPVELKDTTYTLQIKYQTSDNRAPPSPTTMPLEIINRNYYREYVALNQNLAARKASPPSPEVIAQAKELWSITQQVDSTHMYAINNFLFPIDTYKYVSGMFADKRIYTYLDGNEISGTSHGGVDIVATRGTPVRATAEGVVVFSSDRVVTGKSVVLVHFPGVYSMYYHLQEIQVQVGEKVPQGAIVGTVGSTGFSTGPHLHWEIRVNNIRIDPLLSLGELDKIRVIELQY